jgi:hypothetical protein
LDVPAWLLLNSMRMEGLQFIRLGLQELSNVWRKRALASLIEDVHQRSFALSDPSSQRLRRFLPANNDQAPWLVQCINQFREVIGFPIEERVPVPQLFSARLGRLLAEHDSMISSPSDKERVAGVVLKITQVSDARNVEHNLDAEIVQENEAEAEEEAEEEAQQEEQKMDAFTRDDEQPNPWLSSLLGALPNVSASGEDPFYPLHQFRVRAAQPQLPFPPNLLISDNCFRPRWIGVGDRRLKNVSLIVEWVPEEGKHRLQKEIAHQAAGLVGSGVPPAQAAARAIVESMAKLGIQRSPAIIQSLSAPPSKSPYSLANNGGRPCRFVVAVSLAEGETIRRLIHCKAQELQLAGVAMRLGEGDTIDRSLMFSPEVSSPRTDPTCVATLVQCLRFFNCEMYYTPDELALLATGLADATLADRVAFFEESLRLRRRERNQWTDTPLAHVFVPESAWADLSTRAQLDAFNAALKRLKGRDPVAMFSRFDTDGDGILNYAELQRCFDALRLGFSAREIADVVRLADKTSSGCISFETFCSTFYIPEMKEPQQTSMDEKSASEVLFWQCSNCTFLNSTEDSTCAMCEFGWTGRREVPRDKWMCSGEQGGCTFFNPKTMFYCEMCNRARPDVASLKL